jgi:hypothetical protein
MRGQARACVDASQGESAQANEREGSGKAGQAPVTDLPARTQYAVSEWRVFPSFVRPAGTSGDLACFKGRILAGTG